MNRPSRRFRAASAGIPAAPGLGPGHPDPLPVPRGRAGRPERLVGAGLAALLLLGGALRAGLAEDPAPADVPKAPLPAGEIDKDDAELAKALTPVLEARPDWKELLALRRELRQALPVDRDPGPEGLKDVEGIRGKLDRAARLVDAVAASGAQAPGAAEFLRRDVHELSRVAQRLSAPPPGKDPYADPLETAVAANVRFLSESLALLEEIASRADTRPQVAAEILESLEPRLALLSDTRLGFGLTPERKKAGVELRGPLKAVMDSLRRPRTRPLEQEPRWSRFRATWERAQALLAGKAAWPEAKAGWEALLASLDEAARRLDSLGADGTLGEGEILWVRRQYGPALDGVRKKHEALRAERMTAKDPNNPIPVTSTVVVEPPEVASLNRLKRLLPALEKMAAQERVRAEIVLEISGTLDPDLDRLARLPGHRDSDTVKRAKALLAIIKSK